MIVCLSDGVQRVLFQNFSFFIDNASVPQVSFSAVDTDNIYIFGVFDFVIDQIVEFLCIFCFEVQSNWNMELKVVEFKSVVFAEIIFKDTLLFGMIRVFVINSLIFGVGNFGFDALFTIENFRTSV